MDEADKELVDADIVISQPFFPYYLTREKMESAPNLKMAITAGIGSDHVDLQAAMDNNVDVVEVTYCNSRSVAEHIVMMILSMVRDYHNQHRIVKKVDGILLMLFKDHTTLKVCMLELSLPEELVLICLEK